MSLRQCDGQHIQITIDIKSTAIHASNYRQYDGQHIEVIHNLKSSAIHASNYIQIICYLIKSAYLISSRKFFVQNGLKSAIMAFGAT